MSHLHESQPAMCGVEGKEPCRRSMRQCTQIIDWVVRNDGSYRIRNGEFII